MSGSGATCFALFATEQDARRAETVLAERFPGWWIAAAPMISGR
jgi:4-diphosphocytidyl-2-C-methyl-D-erythritol kinase